MNSKEYKQDRDFVQEILSPAVAERKEEDAVKKDREGLIQELEKEKLEKMEKLDQEV